MMRRHKLMTMLSVAAALAVLFAALALAAGSMVKPRVDNVAASRGSGAIKEEGQPAEKSPEEPSHTRQTASTPVPDEGYELAFSGEEHEASSEEYEADRDLSPVFYATLKGTYFHENEHCGGMHGAMPWSFGALWLDGKQPCPVCIPMFDAPEIVVYATPKGKYYHIYSDCSGMKDASALGEAYAKEKGKDACPVCISGTDALCWATPNGQYYHSERECMGMRVAQIYTERMATHQGKQPCPMCWAGKN